MSLYLPICLSKQKHLNSSISIKIYLCISILKELMLFKEEHVVYASDVLKRIQLIFTGMFSLIYYMCYVTITLTILQRENKRIQISCRKMECVNFTDIWRSNVFLPFKISSTSKSFEQCANFLLRRVLEISFLFEVELGRTIRNSKLM